MIAHILIASDFSIASRRALEQGLWLARRVAAKVTLIHAYELPATGFPQALLNFGDVAQRLEQAANAAMHDLARSVDYPVSTKVVLGYPAHAILDTAKEIDADLIVLGTHGQRGLTGALLGSVAEKVVRAADRAVMTVHRDAPAEYTGPILVGTDFSPHAERALDYGLDLARALRLSLVLAHTYELPVFGFTDLAFLASADLATDFETQSRSDLDQVLAKRENPGVPVRSMILRGEAASAVTQAAEELRGAFIVVGTHGRRGIGRAILGSIAERVVRTSQRPVVTVR